MGVISDMGLGVAIHSHNMFVILLLVCILPGKSVYGYLLEYMVVPDAQTHLCMQLVFFFSVRCSHLNYYWTANPVAVCSTTPNTPLRKEPNPLNVMNSWITLIIRFGLCFVSCASYLKCPTSVPQWNEGWMRIFISGWIRYYLFLIFFESYRL